MLHDFDYEAGNYKRGDDALIQRLGDPPMLSYPWLAKNLFRVMSKARELGLLDPGIEQNPGPPKRLGARMKDKPWTEVRGGEQQTPAFPTYGRASHSLRYTFGAANTVYTTGTINYPMNSAGTTQSTYLDAPLPFTVSSVIGTNSIVPQLKGNSLVDIAFRVEMPARTTSTTTGASMWIVKVSTYNGAGALAEQQFYEFPRFQGTTVTVNDVGICGRGRFSMAPGWSYDLSLSYYSDPGVTWSSFSTGLLDISCLYEGPNMGLATGPLWVPFTDRQLGKHIDGVQPTKDIIPWAPPKDPVTGLEVKPLPYVVHSTTEIDCDESQEDDSDSDYGSDTSDEVSRMLHEFKANRRARKEHDELHARGTPCYAPRIPVEPITKERVKQMFG